MSLTNDYSGIAPYGVTLWNGRFNAGVYKIAQSIRNTSQLNNYIECYKPSMDHNVTRLLANDICVALRPGYTHLGDGGPTGTSNQYGQAPYVFAALNGILLPKKAFHVAAPDWAMQRRQLRDMIKVVGVSLKLHRDNMAIDQGKDNPVIVRDGPMSLVNISNWPINVGDLIIAEFPEVGVEGNPVIGDVRNNGLMIERRTLVPMPYKGNRSLTASLLRQDLGTFNTPDSLKQTKVTAVEPECTLAMAMLKYTKYVLFVGVYQALCAAAAGAIDDAQRKTFETQAMATVNGMFQNPFEPARQQIPSDRYLQLIVGAPFKFMGDTAKNLAGANEELLGALGEELSRDKSFIIGTAMSACKKGGRFDIDVKLSP